MAVINQINLINNVGEAETFDIETKITPAVREYIQNQNVLADIEEYALPSTAGTAVEMPYDGFLMGKLVKGTATPQGSIAFHVNGIELVDYTYYAQPFGRTDTLCVPVKKGDSVYCVSTGTRTTYARFFKQRDYTDR